MAVFKCKMCGGNLEIQEGMTVCECEYCGSTQTVPTLDDEKKYNLFTRANRLRSSCEFDKAAGVYESIVAEFQEEAEAYWGLILCKYGIEYVDDPKTGKKIPTCHRSSFDSVMDDSNFELVMEYSDPSSRAVYREEAKAIEEIRIGIIEVSSKEEPYDIFICYKETDAVGERTIDSVLAQDVYDVLTDKGYRVFFSRITLEDKLGQEYEPYIFAALNSAKVMLAFGTDYEYYNAVWVKNEWSRFLGLIESGEKKTLIPCYKGIDAYDMPKEFARLQAQDLGKVGATQDLLRGIEKIIGKKNSVIETVVVRGGSALTKRGYLYLEDKDYKKSMEYFEKALDENPEDGEAYLGKVFAKLRIQNVDELEALPVSLDSIPDFVKALRFSAGPQNIRLGAILESNRKKVGNNKELVQNILNGNYNNLITLTPSLKQAVDLVDDANIVQVFGVSKEVIDTIFIKYEIYSVLENSSMPLNTKEIMDASPLFAKISVTDMRGMLVELNHAGLIVFEDKHFALISEEYRSSKNSAQKELYRQQIEEFEQKLSALSERMDSIPNEITETRENFSSIAAKFAEEKARAEADIYRINQEIAAVTNRIRSEIASDEAEKKNLEEYMRGLARELSGLGIFQAKRKKDIQDQLSIVNQNFSGVCNRIALRQNELQGFVASRQAEMRAIYSSVANIPDAEAVIKNLESELVSCTAQAKELERQIEELKQMCDDYEWMPERIDADYNDNEFEYKFMMPVEDVFSITGRGTVCTGKVAVGEVKLNDSVRIIHSDGSSVSSVVTGIEMFRKLIDSAKVGDNVGLLLRGVDRSTVTRGDMIAILDSNGLTESDGSVNVELTVVGIDKVKAIKNVREITGLGLKEAKDLVDAAPSMIREGVSMSEAENIKRIIELDCQGAQVTIR